MTTPAPELPRGLREALLAQSGSTETPSSHLDDLTLAGLADGTLPARERDAAVVHLARCSACRAAVAGVANALADPAVALEISAADPIRTRRRYVIPLSLAAAAALVIVAIGLQRGPDSNQPGIHRDPTITGAATPDVIAPLGRVAAAGSLRWSSVTGADRYRVTLFSDSGRVVYEAEQTDTATLLPDSLQLRSGRRYLWKVEARVGFDRWVSSRLAEFELAPPPQ